MNKLSHSAPSFCLHCLPPICLLLGSPLLLLPWGHIRNFEFVVLNSNFSSSLFFQHLIISFELSSPTLVPRRLDWSEIHISILSSWKASVTGVFSVPVSSMQRVRQCLAWTRCLSDSFSVPMSLQGHLRKFEYVENVLENYWNKLEWCPYRRVATLLCVLEGSPKRIGIWWTSVSAMNASG